MGLKFIRKITAVTLLCLVSAAGNQAEAAEKNYPGGFLAWHSYSEYSAMDSRLMIRDPGGKTTEIKGRFVNQMNADFGKMPYDIVFMAIDTENDEWDIYRYNLITGNCKNLTEKSGFRNEDPKFSADGANIVFKRGCWNSGLNDFVYDLYEMDANGRNIKRLTDTPEEESMPYYSADGQNVWYARSLGESSGIFRLNIETGNTEEIFTGEYSYYPIDSPYGLYFPGWWSNDNRNDCIRMLSQDGKVSVMPFCDREYNCSDPCPVTESSMIFSSSENGNYDLWLCDGSKKYELEELNTDKQELGAVFFSESEFLECIDQMTRFFYGDSDPLEIYDINEDKNINILDYCLAESMKVENR